jgi:hypothetical protein
MSSAEANTLNVLATNRIAMWARLAEGANYLAKQAHPCLAHALYEP